MGSHAIAYDKEIKSRLKAGAGGFGLGDDDLERLEISFLVDEQIDEVRALGDRRRFWNLVLDVEHSSYHPEKYLTKGGKALYCLEHLIGSGATVIDGKPVKMSEWAEASGPPTGALRNPIPPGRLCRHGLFHAPRRCKERPRADQNDIAVGEIPKTATLDGIGGTPG